MEGVVSWPACDGRNCAKLDSLLGVPLDGSWRELDAGEAPKSRFFELGVRVRVDRGVLEVLGKMLSRCV